MRTGDVAGAVGRGLSAGMAGTALMTLSSTIEMKVQGREASSAPADAAAKVLGVDWASGLVMLPALGVAPPLREWGVKALATDAFHHLVYAAGTSLAFSALDRS